MATHSSILAQRISQTVEPGGRQSMGSQSLRHNCATLAGFTSQDEVARKLNWTHGVEALRCQAGFISGLVGGQYLTLSVWVFPHSKPSSDTSWVSTIQLTSDAPYPETVALKHILCSKSKICSVQREKKNQKELVAWLSTWKIFLCYNNNRFTVVLS